MGFVSDSVWALMRFRTRRRSLTSSSRSSGSVSTGSARPVVDPLHIHADRVSGYYGNVRKESSEKFLASTTTKKPPDGSSGAFYTRGKRRLYLASQFFLRVCERFGLVHYQG
jgi:hypothetical protein